MKRYIADGSVGIPHVRVGHRQAPKQNPVVHLCYGIFLCLGSGLAQAMTYYVSEVIPDKAGAGSRQAPK